MKLDSAYFKTITGHLHALSQTYADAERQVIAIWPTIDKGSDMRLTAFAKCGSVIVSTTFSMHLLVRYLLSDKWWQENVSNFKEFQPCLIDYILEQHQQVVKLGFVYLFFSSIESSFRTFATIADPKFADNDKFKNVYGHLIKKLKLSRHYINLLDLMRLCRNTTHTNGYHNAPNAVITYKGKKYPFVKGETPMYFEWSELTHLMYDVKDLLLEIVKSPQFATQDKINDPFAIVTPFTPKSM